MMQIPARYNHPQIIDVYKNQSEMGLEWTIR